MKMAYGTFVDKVEKLGECFQIHARGIVPFTVEAADFDIESAQGVELLIDAMKVAAANPKDAMSIDVADSEAGAKFYRNNQVIGTAKFKR